MSTVKDKLLLLFGSILFVVACGFAAYVAFFKQTDYYVQIDNSRVQEEKNEYIYSLRTYDAHGRMKDFVFTANKKLREGAYLRLETNTFRGVTYWEEINYGELPQDVQIRYQEQ